MLSKSGKKKCTRATLIKPVGSGKPCKESERVENCDVDCRWTDWTVVKNPDGTTCSAKCGRKLEILYAGNHSLFLF